MKKISSDFEDAAADASNDYCKSTSIDAFYRTLKNVEKLGGEEEAKQYLIDTISVAFFDGAVWAHFA